MRIEHVNPEAEPNTEFNDAEALCRVKRMPYCKRLTEEAIRVYMLLRYQRNAEVRLRGIDNMEFTPKYDQLCNRLECTKEELDRLIDSLVGMDLVERTCGGYMRIYFPCAPSI